MKLNELNCINDNINLDEYIELREKVKQNMDHPEWLGDFSKEDLEEMLNNNSKIWIYYLNEEPVCSMMLIPSDEKSLLKFELDLDYREVVDYGPMFVNPKYVGNGLQFQMLKELDKYCANLGYKHAASTVHPDNIYSSNNLIKDNFELKNTKKFKRGIRNIYLKKLSNITIENKITGEEFHMMRECVNWKDANVELLDKALDKSMIVVGIYENEELVAMGRLVGDYYFKALLSDIIVKPEYQGKGYGKLVVTKIVELAKENMNEGNLMCIEGSPTKGNLEFYLKCGFKYKPEIQDGIYLWLKK